MFKNAKRKKQIHKALSLAKAKIKDLSAPRGVCV